MVLYRCDLDRPTNTLFAAEITLGSLHRNVTEIDNAAELYQLLENAKSPLVDTAPRASEETMRKLGPDLPAQVKRKIDAMNAHWEDYKKLFTSPNP